MVFPVVAPTPSVVNSSINSTPVSVVDRVATQSNDKGEARRVSANTELFVREPKENERIEERGSQELASRQSIQALQAQQNRVPAELINGPRGTNVDFYV